MAQPPPEAPGGEFPVPRNLILRLIFLTDVHHAFRNLESLLERTAADLYLVAGDLVARAFFRYEAAWRFMELQQILGGYRSRSGLGGMLDEVARRVEAAQADSPLAGHAREYLSLCQRAEAFLQRSYDRMETLFSRHPGKTIHVLPGNYDMDLRRTALRNRNLHLCAIRAGGLVIAGYGGANVATPGIPDHLQVPFREPRPGEGARSEPLDFFREARPDVLVLHQPPYGFLDRVPGQGHTGSPGIRDYVDEGRLKVVLSGHNHDHWGAVADLGTRFFNPSNFGSTLEAARSRPGGYFFDLDIRDGEVEAAALRRMEKRGACNIVEYRPGARGMEMVVLDEKRYSRMGGRMPKVRHIGPIRQLQRIRSFFLGYETPETRELVNQLRGIYRDIQRSGMEVAFDLLGSLSFGMAHRDSDMDLVVYMRNRDCVLDESDTCGVPRPLAAVFDGLKRRHLEVEVCDSLDLDRIGQAIEAEDADDGQVQRFIFYRAVCRPVNLRLIKGVENALLDRPPFRRKVERELKEYLEILVSSVRHVKSFEKYKARLRDRGIPVAAAVEEAIRNYLRG